MGSGCIVAPPVWKKPPNLLYLQVLLSVNTSSFTIEVGMKAWKRRCFCATKKQKDRKGIGRTCILQINPPRLHTHTHTKTQRHTHVHFSNGFLKKGPQLQRGKPHRESICLPLQSSYTSLKTPRTGSVSMDTQYFIPPFYSVIFPVYLSFSGRPIIPVDWRTLLLHTRTCCFLRVSMSQSVRVNVLMCLPVRNAVRKLHLGAHFTSGRQ